MMTTTNDLTFTANLRELADYSKLGVSRKALIKDEQINFALICLSAGTKMPEHTAARSVSVTVIEGYGILTLTGQEITLEPGVFLYLPANTPHALHAIENLAFLHT
jgi:quercetin dioxygenase-like cupin family protein